MQLPQEETPEHPYQPSHFSELSSVDRAVLQALLELQGIYPGERNGIETSRIRKFANIFHLGPELDDDLVHEVLQPYVREGNVEETVETHPYKDKSITIRMYQMTPRFMKETAAKLDISLDSQLM